MTAVAIVSILIGVVCGCTSVYSIFTPAMMKMQGSMWGNMKGQMERDFERQRQRDVDRLQRERESATTPEQREQIDEEMRQVEAREVPDMQKVFSAMIPPEAASYYVVTGILGTVLSLLFLVSGIGLLPMMEWARKLNIATSVIDILSTLGMTIYNVAVIGPAMGRGMEEMMREMQKAAPSDGPQPPVDEIGSIMQVSMGAGMVIFAVVFISWFIAAICMLRSRRVNDAFRAATAARRG